MKRVPRFIPDLPSQKEPRNLFITSGQPNSYIQASLGNCTKLRSHFFFKSKETRLSSMCCAVSVADLSTYHSVKANAYLSQHQVFPDCPIISSWTHVSFSMASKSHSC